MELGWPEALVARLAGEDHGFAVRAPRHYLQLARPNDPNDPILRQILPDPAEGADQPEEFQLDAVGDRLDDNALAPGLVHKYAGRALLVATGACATNCRFCFRRNYPYGEIGEGGPGFAAALDAVAADPDIEELILSGGDPLSLPDEVLRRLTTRAAALPQLRRLRLHTRMPVVLPDRISTELIEILLALRPLRVWVVTHFNCHQELSPEALAACGRLIDAGIPVLNQSVLLRGVNDSTDELARLCEGLVDAGIKPYYLHQLDRVVGTAHFEVPEEEARPRILALRDQISGIAVPQWVRDLPGRASKTLLPLLAGALLLGCQPPQADSEKVSSSLGGQRAADVVPRTGASLPVAPLTKVSQLLSADLDGDGQKELLAGHGDRIVWGSWPASSEAPSWSGQYRGSGMLQRWTAWDFDGDGREEVVAAFGMGRGHTEANLELILIDGGDRSTVAARIWAQRGPRTQATSIQPWPKPDGTSDIYIASFEDRFNVRGGILSLQGGEPEWLPGHRLRMGMARSVGDFDGDGQLEVAVGRLYGDTPEEDGDLRVLERDGSSRSIPTLRGIRSLSAGDVDGDGTHEILFGDGWHQNYGKLARFRPNIARWNGRTWKVDLLEERDDQYSIESIGLCRGELVAAGTTQLRRYVRDGKKWKASGEPIPSSASGAWTQLGDQLITGGRTIQRVALD